MSQQDEQLLQGMSDILMRRISMDVAKLYDAANKFQNKNVKINIQERLQGIIDLIVNDAEDFVQIDIEEWAQLE